MFYDIREFESHSFRHTIFSVFPNFSKACESFGSRAFLFAKMVTETLASCYIVNRYTACNLLRACLSAYKQLETL